MSERKEKDAQKMHLFTSSLPAVLSGELLYIGVWRYTHMCYKIKNNPITVHA